MPHKPSRLFATLLPAVLAAAAHAQSYGVYATVDTYDLWQSYHIGDGTFEFDYMTNGGGNATAASASCAIGDAHAAAYGSLASGAMHLGAFASPTQDSWADSTISEASVRMFDTLTMTNHGDQAITIPLTVQFDGILKNRADSRFHYRGFSVNYYSPDWDSFELYRVVDRITIGAGSSVTFTPDVSASVTAGSHVDDLDDSMSDYTHTLKLMWDLPTDVTYTSASGQFAPQAVPEPASMAMLGLGAVAVLRRRRKR
jgi:hypothetical protein